MDIDALRTFLEVNCCRHFGQAAKNLFVSQSTVSARIKLLEDRVGVPVFIRQRNNIQLTSAGEKLLRYADTIVTTWIRARQEIALEDEHLIPFVVGAQPSLWDSVLGDWMQYINNKVPDLVINAGVHSPDALSRQILDGTMDIAFVFDYSQMQDFECVEVTHIPFVMISSTKNLSKSEATKENYILVEWGTSFAATHAKHFADMPAPRMRVMLGRIALNYILANGGNAYMPKPMVESYLDSEELFIVHDAPLIKRTVYAIFPHNSEKKELIDLSCQYFAN